MSKYQDIINRCYLCQQILTTEYHSTNKYIIHSNVPGFHRFITIAENLCFSSRMKFNQKNIRHKNGARVTQHSKSNQGIIVYRVSFVNEFILRGMLISITFFPHNQQRAKYQDPIDQKEVVITVTVVFSPFSNRIILFKHSARVIQKNQGIISRKKLPLLAASHAVSNVHRFSSHAA